MNIPNIMALANQLEAMGFESPASSLLKRICFQPQKFSIVRRLNKNPDTMTFHLYFEKDKVQNDYILLYYDAILQRETEIEMGVISGVEMTSLDKQMAAVVWKKAFEEDGDQSIKLDGKTTWEIEERIECIITQLKQLEATDGGKRFSDILKLKHWSGTDYEDLLGPISSIRNKLGIGQRFYLPDAQSFITVDEAYRFLQNKWLEKQLTAKKKHIDEQNVNEARNDNYHQSAGSMKKKKSGKKAYRGNEAEKN